MDRLHSNHLTGVSGVLHLASPLAGKLPPAEMLDVRMRPHACVSTPSLLIHFRVIRPLSTGP